MAFPARFAALPIALEPGYQSSPIECPANEIVREANGHEQGCGTPMHPKTPTAIAAG